MPATAEVVFGGMNSPKPPFFIFVELAPPQKQHPKIKIKEGGLGEFIPQKTTSAVAGMGLSKFRKLGLSPAYGFGL